jgi:fluoride ion exporter CrcB/FEX
MKNIQKSSKEIIIIGWVGTIILFSAYALNTWGFIESTGLAYGFSNLVAAILLGIRVYADRNWSNLVLEIFFGFIAITSLVRYFFF